MKKILTQVYEIQTPEEAETMIDLGVDHIGSVLTDRKQRESPMLKKTIDTVRKRGAVSSLIPLFNDHDAVMQVLNDYRPDIVHFCEMIVEMNGKGNFAYNPGFIERLTGLQKDIRQTFPRVKIMRSIPIAPSGFASIIPSLEIAGIFEPVSDFFLTDTFLVSESKNNEQPVEGFVGITGKTCDWNTASLLVKKSRLPVMLAGGISPENVHEAVLAVRPAGVDSCTLTNAKDHHGLPVRFQKDPEKVKKFVAEVRRAEKKL